jgi:hypothetical protein
MRTRTGWLAMLLTAGMALAPTTVRAQDTYGPGLRFEPSPLTASSYVARGQLGSPTNDYDVPIADVAYPLPLYHDHPETGGFFVGSEFMWLRQTNPLKHQLIAVRGLVDNDGTVHAALPAGTQFLVFGQPFTSQALPLPGGFIGSAQAALFADNAGGPSTYVPGFNVFMGYRFHEGFEAEVNYLHMYNARYIGGATLIPQGLQSGNILENTFLFSPVFNFPTAYAGPAEKLAIGNPLAVYGIWNGATEMSLRFDQRYDEWNVGARVPICETECDRCYGLAGLRNAWIWENFRWQTTSYDFQGLADATDSAIYNNIVSNEMYGPYIGIGNEFYLGHGFSISLDVNVAVMVDFVREIAKYEREDLATESKRSARVFTIAPELEGQLNVWWYPIEGVELRVGYDVKSFFNTIASPDPVSFNFDGLDPPWIHKTYRLVDGFRAGIAFIF